LSYIPNLKFIYQAFGNTPKFQIWYIPVGNCALKSFKSVFDPGLTR